MMFDTLMGEVLLGVIPIEVARAEKLSRAWVMEPATSLNVADQRRAQCTSWGSNPINDSGLE